MEGKNFEIPAGYSSPEDKDKMLIEMLAAENEGEIPEEYETGDIKFKEKNIFEKTVENIFSKAEKMVLDDLGNLLDAEEKLAAKKIINERISVKKSSSLELWTNEINRLMQEKGDIEEFKKRAANNLYREIKDRILEKFEKSEEDN